MDPKQQAVLAQIGRSGWSVVSHLPSTEMIAGPTDPVTQKAAQVPKYPEGSETWVITDGKGHNQTMVVQPPTGPGVGAGTSDADAAYTPFGSGSYSVVDPPKDLPKPTTLEHLDIGGVAYEKDAAGNWDKINVPGNAPTSTRNASQDALSQAQADAIKGKTPLEIAELVSRGVLTSAQAQAVKDKTPAEIAQMVAGAGASNASAAATNAKLPAELANLVSSGQLTNAQAQAIKDKTPQEIANLVSSGQLTQAQADATKAKAPAEIAELEARTAASKAATKKTERDLVTPTAVTTNALDQYIYQMNPATGKLETVLNKNYHPTDPVAQSQNLQAQAQAKRDELQAQTLNGTITPEEAQKQFGEFWTNVIEPAKQALKAAQDQKQFDNQITAASQQNQQNQTANQAAGTGASLLNQRAQTAKGAFDTVMGIGTSSKNFGIGPGGAPDVSGLPDASAAWATALGGGQGVYDAAANMVKQIDPGNSTGFAPHAAAVLGQVLDRAHGTYQPGGGVPQAPAGADYTSGLNQARYGGAFAPPPQASAPMQLPTTAPTTVIRPDGTIEIQHVQAGGDPYAGMASVNS